MSARRAGGKPPKMVNVALQGGGSHGAFTWGVLDRLLEDGRIGFEAISGTSAGAMNAIAVAHGFVKGGHDGAREALEVFWRAIGSEAAKGPIHRSIFNVFMGNWSLENSPSYQYFDHLTRLASPYELNLQNYNPIRNILEAQIDFDRIMNSDEMKLFISATNVHTGRVKVFPCADITLDVIMASACLPTMFQAVEIDGIPYWDGGYMGNPALFPFFNSCASSDVILVQINPIERKTTPKTAHDIANRVNEIAFNSSLLKELRAIEFVARLIDEGKLDPSHYKQVLLHRIEGGDEMLALSASSKVNAEWAFLSRLRDLGRETAGRWLDENFGKIGKESSLNIRTLYEG